MNPDIWMALSAAVAAVPPTIVAIAGYRRSGRLHDEVRTNHGRPAREYLEMVAEVRTDVRDLREFMTTHAADDTRAFDDLRVLVVRTKKGKA